MFFRDSPTKAPRPDTDIRTFRRNSYRDSFGPATITAWVAVIAKQPFRCHLCWLPTYW
jgi:hypothetical protein